MPRPSRTFERPNPAGGFTCPVCLTSADLPVVLAPIPGTQRDGLVECQQVHVECWDLMERMSSAPTTKDDTN